MNICEGAPNERLVAVYAQNLALEMDHRYRECLRWEHQDWLDMVNGLQQLGSYRSYSLPTEGGGILEIKDG